MPPWSSTLPALHMKVCRLQQAWLAGLSKSHWIACRDVACQPWWPGDAGRREAKGAVQGTHPRQHCEVRGVVNWRTMPSMEVEMTLINKVSVDMQFKR